MTKLFHAFYSFKQFNIIKGLNESNNYNKSKHASCIWRLNNSDKKIIATQIFSVEKYPDYTDCDFRFTDGIYLGIVDKFISIGL